MHDAAKDAQKSLDDTISKMEEESKRFQDNLSRMKSETEYNELVLESGCEADVMQAAMNVVPYCSSKSPQACLVNIVNLKQEITWEHQDVLHVGKDNVSTFALKDWRSFADEFLGRVSLQKNKLTLSLNQVGEESNLLKCFRKIGLLVDAFRKNYKKMASTGK